MRIIFIPQFPSEMRYQEWWFTEFPKQFRERGFEVLTLGEHYINKVKDAPYDPAYFSPIKQAIFLENLQAAEYMDIEIRDDDVLFLADISFPGMFCNVLYHKKCPKMFAFCHATSLNTLDYFEEDRNSKFPVETAHAMLFDKVFVGSKYHQDKLTKNVHEGWKNTMVTYLPYQPYTGSLEPFVPKQHMFMSASRPSLQKVDMELETEIEKISGEKIFRPTSNSWEEYFANLRSSHILLITAKEDTFGYQIVDAVRNGCYPMARKSFAYPELLPDEFLYKDLDDLCIKIDCLGIGEEYQQSIPRLLCEQEMQDFYAVICDEMRERK